MAEALTTSSTPISNVLVFPGGTEIGLEIGAALRDCRNIRLFSAGMAVLNHAPYVFASHTVLPPVSETGWVEALNRLIAEHRIDYIIPAHDDVIVALADHADQIDCRIISSPRETCRITRSKSQTYRCLADSAPTPRLYEGPGEVEQYPVFVKPDRGQGSLNTFLAEDEAKLKALLKSYPGSIIVEYLPGAEFTIDCFSDREKGLLFCGGRQRLRTRAGISMTSRPVQDPAFREIARAICARLDLRGAWFFQLKKDRQGQYKLLEVAPRIAGAMACHRVLGVNFPLLSIYEEQRIPIGILTNAMEVEIDRALINRYRHNLKYAKVYVDLDDTLVLNGRVNVRAVAFLYQCVNRGIPVVLLTRHTEDIDRTLRRFRLSGLFDQVVHCPRPRCKSDCIAEADAIFIDDSYSERKLVADKLGICTFDCSMLEVLMDDRA